MAVNMPSINTHKIFSVEVKLYLNFECKNLSTNLVFTVMNYYRILLMLEASGAEFTHFSFDLP